MNLFRCVYKRKVFLNVKSVRINKKSHFCLPPPPHTHTHTSAFAFARLNANKMIMRKIASQILVKCENKHPQIKLHFKGSFRIILKFILALMSFALFSFIIIRRKRIFIRNPHLLKVWSCLLAGSSTRK